MASVMSSVDLVKEAQIENLGAEMQVLDGECKGVDQSDERMAAPCVKTVKDVEERFSNAHCSKIMWWSDVKLGPPSSTSMYPVDDVQLLDYYNSLQNTLYETGFPETVDRTATPITTPSDHQVVVAVLSAPRDCTGILLEGSRQIPGGFHLILSPSWLTKKPSEKPGLFTLYINKAITFHDGGVTFIDEFTQPRRTTYLLNYFTEYASSSYAEFGAQIERNLDCPMSMSLALCELMENKVWSRGLMAEVGVDVPVTLVFMCNAKYKPPTSTPMMKICEINNDPSIEQIEKEVTIYLQQVKDTSYKVIVKPSGQGVPVNCGLAFHDITDVVSIGNAVAKLVLEFGDGYCILVESFVEPINDSKQENILWAVDPSMNCRVRSTVCRDLDNVPVTTLINCGVASKSCSINGNNTVYQTLDTTMRAFNVTDVNVRHKLEHEIRVKSESVMQAIMDLEKTMSVDEKGEFKAHTDVIGIDFIVTKREGRLVPVVVDLNGHYCTRNCQVFDFMQTMYQKILPMCNNGLSVNGACDNDKNDYFSDSWTLRYEVGETLGKSVRPWIRTMVMRSQLHVMSGKKVLIIGAGGYGRRLIWPAIAEYGIKVVLVDSNPNHFAKDMVYKFLFVDFLNHKQDTNHAKDIVNRLCKEGIEVEGCMTFFGECVPLAAFVGELLGTHGTNGIASCIANSKSRTQEVLYGYIGDVPHWPSTHMYATKPFSIKSDDDLNRAAENIGFPAILKLEHGSGAVGVSLVNNISELKNKYRHVTETLRKEEDFPGIGLGHDNIMMLMEFHGGSEHDIDVVIYKRRLVGAFVSDNGPTNYPSFTETAMVTPSTLPADKQAQLIVAAFQCCTGIGLSDGIYNVEMKMTASGPKLLEINARMGGTARSDWIKQLYGTDIKLCSLMIACGIKPFIANRRPAGYIMCIMLHPSKHNHLTTDVDIREVLQEMNDNGEIIWTKNSNIANISGEFETLMGNIAVKGKTVEEARVKLMKLCDKFNIGSDSYKISEFVRFSDLRKI